MMTEIPASIIGLKNYGLKSGNRADFVILDARKTEEIFTFLPENRVVFRKGRLLHVSQLKQTWVADTGGYQP
jgi:cytosine deaminase